MPSIRDTPSRAASSTGTPQRSNGSTSTPGARPPSRSTSRTPQPALHHRSADEIALKEAQRILGTPTNRILRDADPVFTSGGSARDLRHRKLLEARHEQELEQDDARSQMTEATAREVKAGEDDGTDAETSKGPDEDSEDMEPEVPSRSNGRRTSSNLDNGDAPLTSTSVTTADSVTLPDQSEDETPIVDLGQAGSDDTSSESESESSDSESDSESDSDSDPTSEEDSDAEEERLEQLLSKAKLSATQHAPNTSKGDQPEAQRGEVVLQFDETDKERKEAPIPDLTIPKLPKAHITFTNDGSARASSSGTALLPAKSAGSSSHRATPSLKGKEKAVELEPDNIPYEREMSKREKAHQPRKATASELWTQMPKARSDVLPQMKRDYQALALANSLDPKRFMKGSTKLNKVPETFAIGRIIDQPKHLQDTTLARDQRYRPGQIVQDIVRDESVGSTAKRKYGDLQYKRMENGRGKGWQKRTKW